MFDSKRYITSKRYRKTVDDVLITLSKNLGVPYEELYTGLFFTKGSKVLGILQLVGTFTESQLKAFQKAWKENLGHASKS